MNKQLKVVSIGLVMGSLASCATLQTSGGTPVVGPKIQFSKADLRPEIAKRGDLVYELLVGEIAGKQGQVTQATEHYLNASRLSDDPEIAARTARIATFSKDFSVSLDAAKRWVALEPDSSEARQVAGLLLVRNGDSEAAAEHFIQVIELGGEDKYELGFTRLSLLMVRESVSDEELVAMALVRDHFPEVSYAHRSYAEMAFRNSDYEASLTALEKTLQLDAEDESAKILRSRVLLSMGRVDEALEAMREMTRQSPDDAELLHSLARMLVKANRYEDAHAQYQKAVKLQPDNFDLLYSLALLEVELKSYDDAVTHLQQLAKSPTHADDAHYYLGRVEEERQAYDIALSWYMKLSSGERYMDAQTRVAAMLGKLGKFAEAHEHLARLRNTYTDEASIVHLHLAGGDLYRLNKAFEKAYEHYTGVLKVYPENIDILYARAMVGEKLQRIDWLERDLTAIIVLEPDNATALNALGYTLADHAKNLPQALEYIKRALSIRPGDPAILDSMGWVNFRLGNIEEAEKYLTKALSILEDPEIAGHLGEVLWVRGQHQKAIETVNKALEHSPEDNRLLKLQNRFVQ